MKTRLSINDDPANAPERNLSSARLRPVNISLSIAAQAARVYPKDAREACLWLANLAANSQRIQLCWQHRGLSDPLGTIGRITEAELCERVGLHREEVYQALTGHDDADLPKFVKAVKALRADFEAKLPTIVPTEDGKMIDEAFAVAGDEHRITIVEGKWRHGKTEISQRAWLSNLHNTVWFHCPIGGDERTFLVEFARALGIGANISKKPAQIRQQIKNALGVGLISRVVIDEAQKLWPRDLTIAQPVRVEFIRELRDTLGVGFVLLATDQFALAMELSKQHNKRYAPGQIAGRRYQFTLNDTHADEEIRAIASLHCGGKATESALKLLVVFARAEEGYLGTMVEAIANARRLADGGTITGEHVAKATKNQETRERIKQLALTTKPAAVRSRFKTETARLLAA